MPIMYIQSTPIPAESIAHTCILMSMEGWEPVAVVPVGVMQISNTIEIAGNGRARQTPAVIVLVKKEYSGSEVPKPPTIDYSKKIPGISQ